MPKRTLPSVNLRRLVRYALCALALALAAAATLDGTAFGQSNAPQVTNQAQADALLQVFQQQQQLIAEAFDALMQQSPTPQDIAAWQSENAAVFAEQEQRAQALGTFSSAQPLTYISEVEIPPDATAEISDFLMVRVDLYNRFVQLHNQAVAASGGTTGSDSEVQAAFQAQNAARIAAQTTRAQAIADESASQPLPVPPPLVLPATASPTMKALLVLRDQLMRERIALWNEDLGFSAADQDSAIAQWQQQNASQFQQMQQLAQQLAENSGT